MAGVGLTQIQSLNKKNPFSKTENLICFAEQTGNFVMVLLLQDERYIFL
jgi:hypothetical protein